MTTVHVFCDESSVDGLARGYRVQAGIWVPDAALQNVREALREIRGRHPRIGEYKWGKVSGKQPLTAYKELVDHFFTSSNAAHIHFRSMVVRRDEDPSRKLGKLGRDLGFYKAYFVLLRHRLKPGCRYHIRLDKRTSPRADAEAELQRCLNSAAERDMSVPFVVESCRSIPSHADDLIQLADLFAGAVAWEWNGCDSTCAAKPMLVAQMLERLGWQTLCKDSRSHKFGIWPYRPRRK